MRVHEEIAVSASAERAWAAVADYPSRAAYSERVQSAEVIGGALRPGAKIRLRVDRRAFTVTASLVRPPERLETRFGVPLLFTGSHSYSVRETPSGAAVGLEGEFGGLTGALCARWMRASVARDLRGELAAIKAAAEAA